LRSRCACSWLVDHECRNLGFSWAVGKRCAQSAGRCKERATPPKNGCRDFGSSGNRPKRSERKDLATICNIRHCGGDRSLPEPFYQCGGRNYCARQPDVGGAAGSCSKVPTAPESVLDVSQCFFLFLLFPSRVGKNGLGRLHPRGLVVRVCMPAVISIFPRAVQSMP
jgi:hypothetical protein